MRTIFAITVSGLWLASFNAAAQVEQALPAHKGQIFDAHYSADGRTLATSSSTESVIWNVAASQPIATIGMATSSSHISADGKTLFVLAHAILGVDVSSGEARVAFAEDIEPQSMAVTVDASRVVAGGKRGEVALYDASTAKKLFSETAHERAVSAVAISDDGSIFASGAADGSLAIWSAAGPKLVRRLEGHTSTIRSMVISHDARTLISASPKEFIVWDATTGKMVETRSADVLAVDVRSDGLIAVATTTGLTLLNITSRKEVSFGKGRFFAAAFSPDGKHLATSADPYGSVLRVLDVSAMQGPAAGEATHGHQKGIVDLAYSPSGDLLVSASSDQSVKLWDLRIGTVLATMIGSNMATVRDLTWVPGLDQIAAAVGNEVVLWDNAGVEKRRLADHGSPVVSVHTDSKGRTLLSASEAGSLRLWSTSDASALGSFEAPGPVVRARLHPKGREIYALTKDGVVHVINAKNGKVKRALAVDGTIATALEVDSKGRELLTGGEQGVARLWKTNAKRPKLSVAAQKEPILSVAFHPKGRQLATGAKGGAARLYDKRGKEQKILEGHYDSGQGSAVADITCLSFSPDGKHLATGSGDRSIKIWDLKTGQVIRTLSGFVPYQLEQ